MKGTEGFKKVVEAQLQEMAATDSLFAASLAKETKNIDDCIIYILNEVKKSGCSGFTDAEIFGMAAHYYDEDNLEVGEKISCNVVVNRSVELTAEDIAEAKKEAMKNVIATEQERLTKKPTPKKNEPEQFVQSSLF